MFGIFRKVKVSALHAVYFIDKSIKAVFPTKKHSPVLLTARAVTYSAQGGPLQEWKTANWKHYYNDG